MCGKWTGIPLLLLILGGIFFFSFGPSAQFLSGFLADRIDLFSGGIRVLLESLGVHPLLLSLITDGIMSGIGSVVSFLPMILLLFLSLSFLEECGYLSRIAFLTDRILRPIGLSGNSFVPMLSGFGCSVSACAATRTLGSGEQRSATLATIPFFPCSAKLPVLFGLSAVFFGRAAPLVVLFLYLFCISLGLLICAVGFLLKHKSHTDSSSETYMMEFPPYRFPTVRRIIQLTGEKCGDLLKRVCGLIFLSSVLVWILTTFNGQLHPIAETGGESLLSALAKRFLPLFKPLGITDWRPVAALFVGLTAKETIVSTLGILFRSSSLAAMLPTMTPAAALGYLVFILLYPPCFATCGALRQESGSRRFLIRTVLLHLALAYLLAFLVMRI